MINGLLRIEAFMREGWIFTFDCDSVGYEGNAYLGDTNCPYIKEYDPKDGHGFSEVNSASKVSFEDMINILVQRIDELEEKRK